MLVMLESRMSGDVAKPVLSGKWYQNIVMEVTLKTVWVANF